MRPCVWLNDGSIARYLCAEKLAPRPVKLVYDVPSADAFCWPVQLHERQAKLSRAMGTACTCAVDTGESGR